MSPRLPVTPHGHVCFLWWQSIVTHISPQEIRNPSFKNVRNSIFDTYGNFSYYYAGIMLDARESLLCSKLCQHNADNSINGIIFAHQPIIVIVFSKQCLVENIQGKYKKIHQ